MPRLSIEDSFWSDPRFKALARKIGEFEAIGKCIMAFRIAQPYWAKNEHPIPFEVWEFSDLEELVDFKLAEKKSDGVYIKGSAEHFGWLRQRVKAGQKGGKKASSTSKRKRDSVLLDRDKRDGVLLKQTEASGKLAQASTLLYSTTGSNEPVKEPSVLVNDAEKNPLVCLWNEHCGDLPKVKAITKTRRQKIKTRLSEFPDLKNWESVIKKLAASKWHNGGNERGWKANFDFLLKADTMTKGLEGAYDQQNGAYNRRSGVSEGEGPISRVERLKFEIEQIREAGYNPHASILNKLELAKKEAENQKIKE